MGSNNQEHETGRKRQPAERLTCPPPQGRHAAKHQENATDRTKQEADLSEPHPRVSLDIDRQECHAHDRKRAAFLEAPTKRRRAGS